VGRDEQPADMQWARALAAAVLGLLLAGAATHRVIEGSNPRTVPAELRAAAGLPCLVIRIFSGDF
jgi:hypothetical protein